jgi:hypothetical protein
MPDRLVIPRKIGHDGSIMEVDGEHEGIVHDVVNHGLGLHLPSSLYQACPLTGKSKTIVNVVFIKKI